VYVTFYIITGIWNWAGWWCTF